MRDLEKSRAEIHRRHDLQFTIVRAEFRESLEALKRHFGSQSSSTIQECARCVQSLEGEINKLKENISRHEKGDAKEFLALNSALQALKGCFVPFKPTTEV